MTSADPRPIALDEIKDKLKEGIVAVYFTKINGEPRRMICTWDDKYVPYSNEVDQVKKIREEKTDKPVSSLSVWDTEVKDWRSFRLDSIYRINAEQVKYAGN